MDNNAKALAQIIVNDGDTIELYCSRCKGPRKMLIKPQNIALVPVYHNLSYDPMDGSGIIMAGKKLASTFLDDITPSMWKCHCKQCDTLHLAIIYHNGVESGLLVLSEFGNGVTTEHTPKQVAYYLDQAFRCEIIGANSACVAMYRAALENLLFEQGFSVKLLKPKIDALVRAISEGTAPDWAGKINTQVLEYLKELGNYSIHPNDGDIEKQRIIDEILIKTITYFMGILVESVYEQPYREGQVTDALRGAVDAFRAK